MILRLWRELMQIEDVLVLVENFVDKRVKRI